MDNLLDDAIDTSVKNIFNKFEDKFTSKFANLEDFKKKLNKDYVSNNTCL